MPTRRLVSGYTLLIASMALGGCAGDPTPKASAQYKQIDDALTTHVNAAVTAVPGIHPRSIQVATREGAVILLGTADDSLAAANAAQAAAQVPGVKSVDFDIRVLPLAIPAAPAPLTTTYSSHWVQPVD